MYGIRNTYAMLRIDEKICSTFFFLAVITFKMTPVATQSANWKLAQFQVTDTISQINPTNWTAEQYKEFSLVVSSYVRSQVHCK